MLRIVRYLFICCAIAPLGLQAQSANPETEMPENSAPEVLSAEHAEGPRAEAPEATRAEAPEASRAAMQQVLNQ